MASQSSFASPLYWHIRTLSTALDASNASETSDELEHVFGLYGDDARTFALSVLVPQLDGTSGSIASLPPKTALARSLIVGLAGRPNFVSLLASALQGAVVDPKIRRSTGAAAVATGSDTDSSTLGEGVLEALCSTLKLPQPVQVAVGLGLAFVSTQGIATTSFKFVRNRVRLYSARSLPEERLPFAVFHPLLFLLRTHPASLAEPKNTNDLISRLHAAHPTAVAAVPALPVIQGPVALVDNLTAPAQGEAVHAAGTRTEASAILLNWNRSEDAAAARAVAEGSSLLGPSGNSSSGLPGPSASASASRLAATAKSRSLLFSSSSVAMESSAGSRNAALAIASAASFGPTDAGVLAPLAGMLDDVVGVVLDLGPSCSRSPAAFRAALAVAGRGPSSGARGSSLRELNAVEAAALLVAIANANADALRSDAASSASAATGTSKASASGALSGSVVASFLRAAVSGPHGAEAAAAAASSGDATDWSMDAVCAVLSSDHKSLDWESVARGLDLEQDGGHSDGRQPGRAEHGAASVAGPLRSQEAFALVATAIVRCSGSRFPAQVLLERWQHAPAQLASLRFAVGADASVVSFARVPGLMRPLSHSASGAGTPNQAWCSVGLYRCLFRLAHAGGLQPACLDLLVLGRDQAPELMLLGMAHAKAEAGETQAGDDTHVLRGRMYESQLHRCLGKALAVSAPADQLGVREREMLRGSAAEALRTMRPSDLELELFSRLAAVSPALAVDSAGQVAVLNGQACTRRQAAAAEAAAAPSSSSSHRAGAVVGSEDDAMRALGCFLARAVGMLKLAGLSPRAILGNHHTVSMLTVVAAGVLEAWASEDAAAVDAAAKAEQTGSGSDVATPSTPPGPAAAAVDEALRGALARAGADGERAATTITTTLRRFAQASSPRAGVTSLSPLFAPEVFLRLFRPLQDRAAELHSSAPGLATAARAAFDMCAAAVPAIATRANNDDLEQADAFLEAVFAGTTALPQALDKLAALHAAARATPGSAAAARQFSCIVSNLFGEQAHFHKYPPRELRVVSLLMAGLITRGLTNQHTTSSALSDAIAALQAPLTNANAVKMASFSLFLLAAALPGLARWPEAAAKLVSLPVFQQAPNSGPLADLASDLRAVSQPALSVLAQSQSEPSRADLKAPDGARYVEAVEAGRKQGQTRRWVVASRLDLLATALDALVASGALTAAPAQRTGGSLPSTSAGQPASSSAGVGMGSSMMQPNSTGLAATTVSSSVPVSAAAAAPTVAVDPGATPLAVAPRSFSESVSSIVSLLTTGAFVDRPSATSLGWTPEGAAGEAGSKAEAGQRERMAKHMHDVLSALAENKPAPPRLEEDDPDSNESSSTAAASASAADPSSDRDGGDVASRSGAADSGSDAATSQHRMASVRLPSDALVDQVRFCFNNLDAKSLPKQADSIRAVANASPSVRLWLADYIVGSRASSEAAFHEVLVELVTRVGVPALVDDVREAAVYHAMKSMASKGLRSVSDERKRLKCIGAFLGRMTLAKNRPVLASELDLHTLVLEAYETGKLIPVIGFVAKVAEWAKPPSLFALPNPWTSSLLRLLREVHSLPDVKLNLRFEMEMLFNTLGQRLTEFAPTSRLRFRRRPELKGNPDFAVTASIRENAFPGHTGDSASGTGTGAGGGAGAGAGGSSLAGSGMAGSAGGSGAGASGSSVAAALAEEARLAVVPCLDRLVRVNPDLALHHTVPRAVLCHITAIAVDSSVKESLRTLAERSASVAAKTTRCLVEKDFATDRSHARMRAAASLMASHLAGALAQVQAQEHLRGSLLKSVTAVLGRVPAIVTGDPAAKAQAERVLVDDNLALACALVEKSTMDKASSDAVTAIREALSQRISASSSAPFHDPRFADPSAKWPRSLPAALRASPEGLAQHQLVVYRAFNRSIVPAARPIAQTRTAIAHADNTSAASAAEAAAAVVPAVSAAPAPVAAAIAATATAGGAASSSSSVGPDGAPLLGGTDALNAARQLLQRLVKDARSCKEPGIGSLGPQHPLLGALREVALLPSRMEAVVRPKLTQQVVKVVLGALAELAREAVPRQALLVVVLLLRKPMLLAGSNVQTEVARWLQSLQRNLARSVPLLAALLAGNLIPADQLDVAVADMLAAEPAVVTSPSPALSDVVTLAAALLHRLIIAEGLAPATAFPTTTAALCTAMTTAGAAFASTPEALVAAVVRDAANGSASLARITQHQKDRMAAVEPDADPRSGVVGTALAVAAAIEAETMAVVSSSSAAATAATAAAVTAPSSAVAAASGAGAAIGDRPVSSAAGAPLTDSEEVRAVVLRLLERWVQIWHAASSGRAQDRMFAEYMILLQKQQVLNSDNALEKFIRVTITLCVQSSAATAKPVPAEDKAETAVAGKPRMQLTYTGVDALSKLVALLLKASSTTGDKLATLCKVLAITARTVLQDAAANARPDGPFDQRPYLRLLSNLMHDIILPKAEAEADAASARYSLHVLTAFCNTLHSLRPSRLPCFALAWQALASHRALLTRLIATPAHGGWPLLSRLFADQLRYLGVACRGDLGSPATKVIYKGVLRTALGVVHDAPEFLTDNHHWVCELLPPTCMQLRNLVLSAFPNRMQLPDPFTPSLKVDKLPAMQAPPRIVGDPALRLQPSLRAALRSVVSGRIEPHDLAAQVAEELTSTPEEQAASGARYSWPRVSSTVLQLGILTVGGTPPSSVDVASSPALHLLKELLPLLEADGRYLVLNAVANQLRYPNSHTQFFSVLTLLLFETAEHEEVKEQLTRVLLERLIVNRPHPWGLLITYIELIKQARYRFWKHDFTSASPDILKLLERVAKSCNVKRPEA